MGALLTYGRSKAPYTPCTPEYTLYTQWIQFRYNVPGTYCTKHYKNSLICKSQNHLIWRVFFCWKKSVFSLKVNLQIEVRKSLRIKQTNQLIFASLSETDKPNKFFKSKKIFTKGIYCPVNTLLWMVWKMRSTNSSPVFLNALTWASFFFKHCSKLGSNLEI